MRTTDLILILLFLPYFLTQFASSRSASDGTEADPATISLLDSESKTSRSRFDYNPQTHAALIFESEHEIVDTWFPRSGHDGIR